MILIEFLYNYIARPVARFVIWIVAARDCKHCMYGRKTENEYLGYEWGCTNPHYADWSECIECPWRCHFKRKK